MLPRVCERISPARQTRGIDRKRASQALTVRALRSCFHPPAVRKVAPRLTLILPHPGWLASRGTVKLIQPHKALNSRKGRFGLKSKSRLGNAGGHRPSQRENESGVRRSVQSNS